LEARKGYLSGMGWFKYLLLSLVVLIILDGVITNLLVQYGLGHEGNPILRSIVGSDNFLKIKVAGALLCALILWDIYRRWRRLALISTACFVACYAGIVIWNLSFFFTALYSN